MRESLPLVRKGEKESDVIILDGFDVDFPSVFLKIPNEIFPKFDKAYNSAYNQNLGLGETFLFSAGITGLFAYGIFSRLEIFPLHLASLTTALYGEVLFGIPVKGEIDSFFSKRGFNLLKKLSSEYIQRKGDSKWDFNVISYAEVKNI